MILAVWVETMIIGTARTTKLVYILNSWYDVSETQPN